MLADLGEVRAFATKRLNFTKIGEVGWTRAAVGVVGRIRLGLQAA
jgi:hypothetical protein